MHTDQMRKYGISDISPISRHIWQQSHNKGLYYGFEDAILSHLVTIHQFILFMPSQKKDNRPDKDIQYTS